MKKKFHEPFAKSTIIFLLPTLITTTSPTHQRKLTFPTLQIDTLFQTHPLFVYIAATLYPCASTHFYIEITSYSFNFARATKNDLKKKRLWENAFPPWEISLITDPLTV